MNTEQIIKALECCTSDGTIEFDCTACPYIYKGCNINVMRDALSLINEQQAEIERLKLEKEGAESGAMEAINELQAHIENLKNENKYLRERLVEEMEHAEDMKGTQDD